MSTIVVDAGLLAKLRAAGPEIEFRDDTGAVVRVTKGPDIQRLIDMVGGPQNWPSAEELDRIDRESKWYTSEEVLERLRRLSK